MLNCVLSAGVRLSAFACRGKTLASSRRWPGIVQPSMQPKCAAAEGIVQPVWSCEWLRKRRGPPEEAWAARYTRFVRPPRAPLPLDGDDSSLEAPRSEPTISSHDASSELDDCSSRIGRKCASRDCSFLVHTHPSFGDFCCKMCEKNSGGRHGKKCERRAYRPSQTSKLPRRMLKSEEVAFRSGTVAVRDWHDASELDSLAVRRGDRFLKAEPWDDDDAWLYAWRWRRDDGGGGDQRQEGWVPSLHLMPAQMRL